MPSEKSPAIPVPDSVVPAGGIPYKVKTGDTLVSIAKAYGIEEWMLNDFNWKTGNPYDPAVVNWYLREYMGCTVPTHDKANWTFTSGLTGGRGVWKGGILYLPRKWEFKPIALQKAITNQRTLSADKSDYALPAELKQYYGLTWGTVALWAAVEEAKVIVSGVPPYFSLRGGPTAAHLLDLFLANNGQSPSYPDGGPESKKLKADQQFLNAAKNLSARLKPEVISGLKKVAGSTKPIVIQRLMLDPGKDTFEADDFDLHFAFGRFQGVDVSGKGYTDGSKVTGQLHFTYSIIYGFGKNDANMLPGGQRRTGLRAKTKAEVAKEARLLQLAGEARPLMNVTIKVSAPVQ